MTHEERAKKFVNNHPAIFTADKEWWATEIALLLIEQSKDDLKKLKEGLKS